MTYASVHTWDNLYAAWRKASRGKRATPAVAAFEHKQEEELLRLQDDLASDAYLPGAYQSFHIHEPKRRLISAAPFRDRVLHHALCQVIGPELERTFAPESYANQVGKGTHRALNEAHRLCAKYKYVLPCDVRQFFPAIDHEILSALLAAKIKDPAILRLIAKVLASGEGVLAGEYEQHFFPGDDLLATLRPRGLPIGNLTSQFWANCYLTPFDHFVKRELRAAGYVRYVDDMLLFGDDKDELRRCDIRMRERLAKFRLALHQGSHPRPTTEGVSFLGFILYPQQRRLKARKGWRFARRYRGLKSLARVGAIQWPKVRQIVQAWTNHLLQGDTHGLRRALLV